MKKIFYISLVVLFASCNEDNFNVDKNTNAKTVSSLEDYYKFITNESENQILLQSMGSINDSNRLYSLSSTGQNNENPQEFSINNKRFKNARTNTSSSSSSWLIDNQDLSDLYGKKIKIQLNGSISNSNARTANEEVDMYVPALINASVMGLVDGKVQAGTKIIWNADANNQKGVIIALEYNPTSQNNQNVINANSDKKNTVNGITTEDDGIYQITAEDLSKFPNDAILSFYIVRGEYTINNDSNDNDTSIGAFNALRADFNIKK